MSEQEDIKKTRITETDESAKIRAPEETRIYNATKELEKDSGRVTSRHTWIGEPDDRVTRIAQPVIDDRETRIVSRSPVQEESETVAPKKIDAGAVLGKAKDLTGSAARAGRLAVHDVKNVKVADKKKFSRFLRIVGVLFVILLLELGYFKFASNVRKMPDEIKETQKELADLGVLVEKNWFNVAQKAVSIYQMAENIRYVGAERCYIATDRGQYGMPSPTEEFRRFIGALLEQGMSEEELSFLARKNPERIIG